MLASNKLFDNIHPSQQFSGEQKKGTMMSAHKETVKATVEAMINEIGKLRQLVAIDNMPTKLQQARQLLRELDAELGAKK